MKHFSPFFASQKREEDHAREVSKLKEEAEEAEERHKKVRNLNRMFFGEDLAYSEK